MRIIATTALLTAATALAASGAKPLQDAVPTLDASMTIHLKQSSFQAGEEILADVEFVGHADADYYFDTTSYDRSGRLWQERYSIEPADGVEDPLADLFASGYMGGGIGGGQKLDGSPFVLHVTLNDWFRFRRPGTYTLRATSDRLKRFSGKPAPSLTAQPVTFTITGADPSWQTTELARAAALIDTHQDAEVVHGVAILRYLGTDAAARLVIARSAEILARRNGAWAFDAALLSSPSRSVVIRELEARLDTGNALDPTLLRLLSRIAALAEVPRSTVQTDYARRSERQKALEAEYTTRWRTAAAKKMDVASLLSAELAMGSPTLAEDLNAHPKEAAAAFLAAPAAVQRPFLSSNSMWAVVNRPWMIPVLRTLVDQWHGDSRFAGLGDSALQRLLELAPVEGRRAITDEIQTGAHGFGYNVLASLPDRTLPEVASSLNARLAAMAGATNNPANELALWLAARYETGGPIPAATVSRATSPQCLGESAAAVLAFTLKTNASAGAQLLQSCRRVSFTTIARRYWDTQVQSAAIAALDHAIPDAIDAAQALGSKGTAAARAPLIDRLTRWNNEWKTRVSDLERTMSDAYPPTLIENNVVNALFNNAAFGLTKDDAAKIRELCLTESCRTNVDGLSRRIK